MNKHIILIIAALLMLLFIVGCIRKNTIICFRDSDCIRDGTGGCVPVPDDKLKAKEPKGDYECDCNTYKGCVVKEK